MAMSWILAVISFTAFLTISRGDDARMMYLDYLGGDVDLDCMEGGGAVSNFAYWVLPTGTSLPANFSNSLLKVNVISYPPLY